MSWLVQARPGSDKARQASLGLASSGVVSFDLVRSGQARQGGSERLGQMRHGLARSVWLDQAERGSMGLGRTVRRGLAGPILARSGQDRTGTAGMLRRDQDRHGQARTSR